MSWRNHDHADLLAPDLTWSRIALSSPMGAMVAVVVLVGTLSGPIRAQTNPVSSSVAEPNKREAVAALEAVLPSRSVFQNIDIESLTLESDFTIFMREDCPDELRSKALRRLWTLTPPTIVAGDSPI